ncbi:hypothetical protein [Planococcus shixiaomingii]|nr:hypothetical protein [Planococcus sp. N022]WKA55429.1 hypothetical protein QWY21_03345 [Planococcus sp. N022]
MPRQSISSGTPMLVMQVIGIGTKIATRKVVNLKKGWRAGT